MDIFAHALSITDRLAATISEWEVHCGAIFERSTLGTDDVNSAIRAVWPRLVGDARQSAVSPDVKYLSAVYDQLVTEACASDADRFKDRADFPWREFYSAGCGDESRCEDGWVIAELFWGGYVKQLPLTLGWLIMNAIRVQQNLPAIIPSQETKDRFTEDLRSSGPEWFDAENLRCLMYEYESQINVDAIK